MKPLNSKWDPRIAAFVIKGVLAGAGVWIVLAIVPVFYIHVTSFLLLGLIVEFPECVFAIWGMFFVRPHHDIGKCLPMSPGAVGVRRLLVRIIAPSCWAVIIISGLYLVHLGMYSFQEGWLFWGMLAITVRVYCLAIYHNTYISYLGHLFKHRRHHPAQIREAVGSPFDNGMIVFNFVLYVFIYYALYANPVWANPLAGVFHSFSLVIPSMAVVGAVMLLSGVFLVDPLWWSIKKWSASRQYLDKLL